jgi:predicted Zn-dependent peptidase
VLDTVKLDREINRTTAPNGVTVLSERVRSVRSAAVGVWVRTASAHEPRPKMGVSHLLEHMVFKGTARRSAQEIALSLESRGGSLDAYTSRDSTAYHARVLDTDLSRALDVITDMVRQPTLRDSDLSLERKVVLEEISTVADTPDDEVFDLAYETMWPSHPYGFQILGTRETVSALSSEDLKELHQRAYFPGNCVIAAAGNLTHDDLLKHIEAQGWFNGDGAHPAKPPVLPPVPPAIRGVQKKFEKDSVQTHIVFATDTVPYSDRRKYGMLVLSNLFGGGMSSRLFQRIREELGLAYAIYSFASFYRAVGMTGVYVGTQPSRAHEALEAIRGEYARLAREGLRGDALALAKEQTLGQLMLSLESPTSRMYRLASTAVYGESYRSLDEVLQLVEALTEDDICALAAEYFAPERQTIVSLGPNGAAA